jgi:hypothetical protein
MIMSIKDNKAVAGHWFIEFWDADFNPSSSMSWLPWHPV